MNEHIKRLTDVNGAMIFVIMTFSIMTLSIKGFIVTLNINDNLHNVMLNVTFLLFC
jgi:hypothetical protein